MKGKIFVASLLVCILSSVLVFGVIAQVGFVGVKAGDNFTYSFEVLWSSTNPSVVVPSEFSDMNMAEIARAIGCRGFRVEEPSQLARALAEALAGDSPAVLDVRTSLRIGYEDLISPLVGAAFMFDR